MGVHIRQNTNNYILIFTLSADNKVDGATFLLLEREELKEIVKSVGTIKQLQELQKQLLGATVSILYHNHLLIKVMRRHIQHSENSLLTIVIFIGCHDILVY